MANSSKFTEGANFRTNICERQTQYNNNEIQLRDALQGLDLSVYITNYAGTATHDMFALTEQGRILKNAPGLMAVFLDELGSRAGFKWRNSFGSSGLLDDSDGNRSYNDLLHWTTNSFDISAANWNRSNERRELGVSFFPDFWYDDSVVLIARTKEKLDLSNFLKPFDTVVWIMIALSIVLTGILYNFLERLGGQGSADERQPDSMAALFLASITFTGHFEFKVRNHIGVVSVTLDE